MDYRTAELIFGLLLIVGALVLIIWPELPRKPLDKSGHPKAGLVTKPKRRGKL